MTYLALSAAWNKDFHLLTKEDIEARFMDAARVRNLNFLCADTGYGKSFVLHSIRASALERGWTVYVATAGERDLLSSCIRIERKIEAEKRSKREETKRLLLLDDVQIRLESELPEIAEHLRALLLMGVQIYCALLPEYAFLCEDFPDAAIFKYRDLEAAGPVGDSTAYMLTHRIPALVKALKELNLEEDDLALDERRLQGLNYRLNGLSHKALRPMQSNEEKSLRSAMILLHQASFQELRDILGQLREDMLLEIALDSPFFGIDTHASSFSVAGPKIELDINPFVEALQVSSDQEGRLLRLLSYMFEKNEVRSFVKLAMALCDREDVARFICEHGSELALKGYFDLVKTAFEQLEVRGLLPRRLAKFQWLSYQLLSEEAANFKSELEDIDWNSSSNQAEASLARSLYLLRSLCIGVDFAKIKTQINSIFDRRLAKTAEEQTIIYLAKSLSLMLEGQIEEAFSLILRMPQRKEIHDIASAWLAQLNVVCQAFLAIDIKDDDLHYFTKAQRWINKHGSKRDRAYMLALRQLVAVLAYGQMSFDMGLRTSAVAHAYGDYALAAIFEMAQAMCDLRCRSAVHALVRLDQIEPRVMFDLPYLQNTQLMLKKLAEILDGAHLSVDVIEDFYGLHKEVMKIVVAASKGQVNVLRGHRFKLLARNVEPKDALWLLMLVSSTIHGRVSVRASFPDVWKKALERLESQRTWALEEQIFVADDEDDLDELGLRIEDLSEGHRVYLKAFGNLSVFIDGRETSLAHLNRSRSRLLLYYLILEPQHRLKKYDAISMLWPDLDYARASQRLYESMSDLRQIFGEELGHELLISSRSAGTIELNTQISMCDTDVFERECQHLQNQLFYQVNPGKTLTRIEHVYAGGLSSCGLEMCEFRSLREHEIKDRHISSLIAASQWIAAHETGQLALQYLRLALNEDPVREDAIFTEVKVLVNLHRYREARQSVKGFVYASRRQDLEISTEFMQKLSQLVQNADENQRNIA